MLALNAPVVLVLEFNAHRHFFILVTLRGTSVTRLEVVLIFRFFVLGGVLFFRLRAIGHLLLLEGLMRHVLLVLAALLVVRHVLHVVRLHFF